VVLDQNASPLLEMKSAYTTTLMEALFNLMVLGEDRAVAATIVAGNIRYQRSAGSESVTSFQPLTHKQGA